MVSFNDELRDLLVLRNILLESLKTSYANKVSKAYLDILNDMIKQLKTYDNVDIKNVNQVIKELQQRIDPKVILLSDMQELALVEASYIPTAINAVAGYEMFKRIPRDSTLLKIANGDLFQGHTISQVLKSFDTKIAYDLQDEVKVAVMNGETIPQIRERLNRLMNVKRSQAETIARTATATLVEQVRMETYGYNADVIKGYQYVSVIDSRTTKLCASYDGAFFDINKKPVGHSRRFLQPPSHMSCRSTLIAVVKSFKEMGIDDDDKEIPPATRSSLDGAIPQKTTFSEWFKGKDKAFQEKYLGVGRFELFDKGKITISDLVTKNGKVRTIKELEELSTIQKVSIPKVEVPKVKVPKIDFGYDGKFNKYVEDIRDEAKIVIDKLPKPNNIKEKGSSYQSIGAILSAGGDRVQTFRHEYGHHIDFVLGAKKITGGKYNGSSFNGYSENNFLELLDLDKKHLKITPKTYDTTLKTFVDEFGQMTKIKRVQLEYEMYKLKDEDFGGISDILDAMTGGDLQNRYLGMGHGKAYYKSKEARANETFANLFELYATNNKWGRAKELFPNITSEFEKIMKEVIDGKFD